MCWMYVRTSFVFLSALIKVLKALDLITSVGEIEDVSI